MYYVNSTINMKKSVYYNLKDKSIVHTLVRGSEISLQFTPTSPYIIYILDSE